MKLNQTCLLATLVFVVIGLEAPTAQADHCEEEYWLDNGQDLTFQTDQEIFGLNSIRFRIFTTHCSFPHVSLLDFYHNFQPLVPYRASVLGFKPPFVSRTLVHADDERLVPISLLTWEAPDGMFRDDGYEFSGKGLVPSDLPEEMAALWREAVDIPTAIASALREQKQTQDCPETFYIARWDFLMVAEPIEYSAPNACGFRLQTLFSTAEGLLEDFEVRWTNEIHGGDLIPSSGKISTQSVQVEFELTLQLDPLLNVINQWPHNSDN